VHEVGNLKKVYVLCSDLTTNSDSFITRSLYNRGGECLQCGTHWVLI